MGIAGAPPIYETGAAIAEKSSACFSLAGLQWRSTTMASAAPKGQLRA
jgi:hypothetical protein